jgi:hypothetical protein
VRDALKYFRDAVTGRWAVSLPAYLLTIPFGAMVGFEREHFFNPNYSNTDKLLIVAAGYFSAFIYIFIAQYLLLGKRKIKPQPIWRCIFVWYSTGAIWGIGSTVYARYLYGDVIPLAERLRLPVIYSGSVMALSAFYFGIIDRHRIEADARRKLLSILSTDHEELHEREDSLRNETRETLEANIGKQLIILQELLNSHLANNKSLTSPLSRLRELSSDISKEIKLEIISLSQATKPNIAKPSTANESIPLWKGLFPKVLSVRISLLLIALGAFIGQFPRNGIEGVIAGELGVVLLGIALFTLARYAKDRSLADLPLFIPFSYLTVFTIQVVWTFIQGKVGFDLTEPYNPIYAGLKTVYGIFLASLISELISATSKDVDETRVLNNKVLEEISQRWKNKKALNGTLLEVRYGELQGKIAGVIMAIKLLQNDGESIELHSRLLADAQQLLREASDVITTIGATNEN